ncbi:Bug family tripartite tricarboxylate transporter substrate binding protein [Verticiella sediminum]|nr:tripartite tricarboxylate transporter substrate binding protein [Verticiella sediminum]
MTFPTPSRRRFVRLSAICAFGLAGLAATAAPVWAQDAAKYPERPVRLVVGYAPGGPTDILARVIGQEMGDALGQPLVIENKPGANGNIGTETVQRAAPDGYSILMNTISHNVNPLLQPNLVRYDPIKDFTPIAQVAVLPQVIVVGPASAYKDLGELLAKAKSNPGEVSFGSAGNGGSAHLAAALLQQRSGTQMNHIPFRGNGPALTEVIAGRVDFMFYPMIGLNELVTGGKLRVLAVTTAERMPEYPDVPTTSELGFTGFEDYAQPIGFIGPAGLPKDVTSKLQASIESALDKSEVQSRLKSLGAELTFRSAEDYTTWLTQDRERWADLIKSADIRAE